MHARSRQHLCWAVTASLLTALGLLVASLVILPPVIPLRYMTPRSTAYMELAPHKTDINYTPVPLTHISALLQRAVVAAEDDRFYEHHGVDWEALQDAWRVNRRRDRFSRGGSTITMQLARNLFLSPDKTLFRKTREIMISLKLEQYLSKERILELYLNVVEWGDGIFGAEAAAQHYFNIAAAELNLHQAAFLAAILPQPRFYDHHRNGPYLARRIMDIEAKL